MGIPTDIVKFFPAFNEKTLEEIPPRKSIGEYLVNYHFPVHQSLDLGECLRITRQLVEQGLLIPSGSLAEGNPPHNEVYYATSLDQASLDYGVCDFAAYGFPYIRNYFEHSVQAVVVIKKDGDEDVGSGFLLHDRWFITCRHCIENMQTVKITNWDPSTAPLSKIWVPTDSNIDLAILEFDGDPFPSIPRFRLEKCKVLDDVLAMGYPSIPGYQFVQVSEKAQIAGYLKSTTGQIVAEGECYLMNGHLHLLISARVKGGNSGGPVIGRRGGVAGMVFQLPAEEEGRTDLLGYAAAISSEVLESIKNACLNENLEIVEELPFQNLPEGFRTANTLSN